MSENLEQELEEVLMDLVLKGYVTMITENGQVFYELTPEGKARAKTLDKLISDSI